MKSLGRFSLSYSPILLPSPSPSPVWACTPSLSLTLSSKIALVIFTPWYRLSFDMLVSVNFFVWSYRQRDILFLLERFITCLSYMFNLQTAILFLLFLDSWRMPYYTYWNLKCYLFVLFWAFKTLGIHSAFLCLMFCIQESEKIKVNSLS